MTLYRLYATVTLDPKHWQEGYAIIILLTCLEALLGVVNACLPVLKPVVDRLRTLSLLKSQSNELSFTSHGVTSHTRPIRGQKRSMKRYTTIEEGSSSVSLPGSDPKGSGFKMVELGQAHPNLKGSEEIAAGLPGSTPGAQFP